MGININELTFEILDKDSTRSLVLSFINKHKKEEFIGVLSEAGCPGIADPGALAVAVAQEMNIEVVTLHGRAARITIRIYSTSNRSLTAHCAVERENSQSATNKVQRYFV